MTQTLKIAFLLAFLSMRHWTWSQVCDGNFGDNIFEDGDFGAARPQIVAGDPGIAPGYDYTTVLPPQNGQYTILNAMNSSEVYDSWITFDNTNFGFGYVMIVNASHSPGLFYQKTVEGLCENVLYEFSADIYNLNEPSFTQGIKPNVSFLLDDEVQFSTGEVPSNLRWNNYGFTFMTGPGQTSIKLSLRNNAPGGTGNDLALDNITFRPCGSTAHILPLDETKYICEGEEEPFEIQATVIGSAYENLFFQWQESFDAGMSWENIEGQNDQILDFRKSESGTYYFRYLLADTEDKLTQPKCRTTSNIKIVEILPKFTQVSDTLCAGSTYYFGTQVLTSSGSYVDTVQNFFGCDSIVNLNLTFVENELSATFYSSDPSCSYIWDGEIGLKNISSRWSYSFYINNQPVFSKSTSILKGGTYHCSVIDKYGCAMDTVIFLTPPEPFFVDLGDDETLILGERFQRDVFLSEPGVEFTWVPQSIDCEPSCVYIDEVFMESTVVYSITVAEL